MSLRERLIAEIAVTGPMSMADYMRVCLHDPQDGYYATRPALGAEGDFITAPLVSQMFGELIGLWMVETWRQLGAPNTFRLVEIGPGDGTLMSDLLRVARLDAGFMQAADVWLVETSKPLTHRQRERLGDRPQWCESLEEVPSGAPILLVANELLDCLPVRQFQRDGLGWSERRVGIGPTGDLVIGLTASALSPMLPSAPEGAVFEQSSMQERLSAELGLRLSADGGVALLIDYGRAEPGFGDTLQALIAHKKVSILEAPGQADLTVHADFPAVARAAENAGAKAWPILTQGDFLVRLGVGARAEALSNTRPDLAQTIERQLERLVSPDQMGDLFKVLCLSQSGLAPPGFEAL